MMLNWHVLSKLTMNTVKFTSIIIKIKPFLAQGIHEYWLISSMNDPFSNLLDHFLILNFHLVILKDLVNWILINTTIFSIHRTWTSASVWSLIEYTIFGLILVTNIWNITLLSRFLLKWRLWTLDWRLWN